MWTPLDRTNGHKAPLPSASSAIVSRLRSRPRLAVTLVVAQDMRQGWREDRLSSLAAEVAFFAVLASVDCWLPSGRRCSTPAWLWARRLLSVPVGAAREQAADPPALPALPEPHSRRCHRMPSVRKESVTGREAPRPQAERAGHPPSPAGRAPPPDLAAQPQPLVSGVRLRREELLEGPTERSHLVSTAEAVAGLESTVDRAQDDGSLGIGLAAFVCGEPRLDLGPAPQRVPRGMASGSGEPARATLGLDQLVDRLARPASAHCDL